jgi:hypothetical protein
MLQTYDVKYFNMAKTRLKVIKASGSRLMSLYLLKPLHVQESDRLVVSVLLSVVAQALL